MIKSLLKTFIEKLGYKIVSTKSRSKILSNVFNTNFDKKVLISYLTEPFNSGIKYTHSNYTECYTAAEIFRDLKYNVDVVDFNSDCNINYALYTVIYGQGKVFENAFLYTNTEKLNKIFYGTGTSHFYYYKVSSIITDQFYKEKNLLIPESSRITSSTFLMQFICSNHVIALGNEFCKKTYTDYNPNLSCFNLNAFYFDVYDIDIKNKNIQEAKKHFLWFGSSGLLSKGLGVCIDYFSVNTDVVLHICGASNFETKFWSYYQPIVEKSFNIINHGFVNINGDEFKNILNTCAFTIFPSVSEGGAVSVLNVMANGGLIPIITEGCMVDIDDFGYYLKNSDVKSVEQVMLQINELSDVEILEKSLKTKKIVREKFTLEKYKRNMFQIINECVK